ncbi:MAG TPA: PAC2 family protein [Chitinispirillaceae bacterium]|nr:PAC2 family protein [Chitinispirillaceae bacterium]
MQILEQIHFETAPTFLAAWPGMGNVGLITVDYLRQKLDAKPFAEIDMTPFFVPDSIVVKDGIAQMPELPSSTFYYSKSPDLIIFESNAQISGREGISIIKTILDLLSTFSVERIFTFAAFAQAMSHDKPSEVLISSNSQTQLQSLEIHDAHAMPDGFIAGLNGLLLGVAASQGKKATCLLGTIPSYATNLSYPKASLSIVRYVTKMLSFNIDTSELEENVESIDQQFAVIEERIKEFMPSVNKDEDEEINEIEDEKIPHYVMEKIENLFREASADRAKATELKKELDRWKLFELYEDRFLDLFREKK